MRQRLRDVFGRERLDAAVELAVAPSPGEPATATEPGRIELAAATEPGRIESDGVPPAAAFDPGRRGLRALAAVAAVVVSVAAVLAWQARPRTESLSGPEATSSATAEPQASTAAVVVVAVSGRVRRPGLVRLPGGARVADAIEAAGGALPDTDLSLVNLARKVSDGELITVGMTAPGGGGPGAGGAVGAAAGGKVNLNTATLAELDALPGVGPVLAQRILDHRQRHGGFRSVSELSQVDGIGDARYQELKDLVTV